MKINVKASLKTNFKDELRPKVQLFDILKYLMANTQNVFYEKQCFHFGDFIFREKNETQKQFSCL